MTGVLGSDPWRSFIFGVVGAHRQAQYCTMADDEVEISLPDRRTTVTVAVVGYLVRFLSSALVGVFVVVECTEGEASASVCRGHVSYY